MATLTIVVPTYNERDNIKFILEELNQSLSGIDWEVIFVDDDSPDDTADLTREYAQLDRRVRCIQRIGRRGLSSACIEGMLSCSSPFIAVMDADLQHDSTLLPKMLERLQTGDLDLVVGSRYVEGGSVGRLDPHRVWISKVSTWLGQRVIKNRLHDCMSGFFMLKREWMHIVLRQLYGKGFKILLDLVASSSGPLRIEEIPYVMRARRAGESKLGAEVIAGYFMLLIHKFLGRVFTTRFVMFCIVGASGLIVHISVLGIMYRVAGQEFLLSQAMATLVAMTSNYFLNNYFTYYDNKLKGIHLLKGLSIFYLACSIGALINILLADFINNQLNVWWFAGICGTLVSTIWNFSTTRWFTWGNNQESK